MKSSRAVPGQARDPRPVILRHAVAAAPLKGRSRNAQETANCVIGFHGEKTRDTMQTITIRRGAPRNPTEAAITCRPYASTGAIYSSAGVMRNFSSQGPYIETSRNYQSGTILILRMVRYPRHTAIHSP